MSRTFNQKHTLPDFKSLLLDEIELYTRDRPYLLDLLQMCSVLRWFDSEVISNLLPPEKAGQAPALVKAAGELSFCQENSLRGVTLSRYIRDYLLSQEGIRSRLPQLHQAAAIAYHKLLQAKDLPPVKWFDQEAMDWKILAAEWLYHLASWDPGEAWHQLMLIIARAYAVIVHGRVEVAFSFDLLNRIGFDQIQWPENSPYPERVKELNRNIQLLMAYEDKNVLGFLEELARTPGLTEEEIGSIYQWIGSTCFREAGLWGKARKFLEDAHRLAPTDLFILTELAAYHRERGIYWGRLDLARQCGEEAVQLAPDNPGGYLELGDLSQIISDWEAAIAQYQKALQVNPRSVDAMLGLSEVYTARHQAAQKSAPQEGDDLSLALHWIDTAEEMSTGMHYIALLRKAGAYKAFLKYDEARRVLEEALQEDPERPEAYLDLGKLAAELNQYRLAEEYYQQGREKGSNQEADLQIIQLYEQQDKLEKAVSYCLKLLEEQGKSVTIYRELHNIYNIQGKWKEMEAVWQAWLAVDPGSDYMVDCLMGDAYQAWAWKQRSENEIKDYIQKAESFYKRALEIDSYLAWAPAGMAELALLQENPPALDEFFRAANRQFPWAVYDVSIRLGLACLKKPDFARAQELLTAAVQSAPGRPEGRLALVDLYEAQGEDDKLLQTWAELEELDHTYAPVARLRTGDYFKSMYDYERARQQYELAAQLPDPVEARLRLAKLNQVDGNQQSALEHDLWLLENAPQYYALVQSEMSAIFLERGAFDDAEVAARRAIVSDPEDISGYFALARLAVEGVSPELLQEARGRLKSTRDENTGDLEFVIGESIRKFVESSPKVIKDGDVRTFEWSLSQARQAYLKAIKENEKRGRDDPEAELGLALVLIQQKKFKEAQQRFQHALDRFGPQQDFDAYLKFGQAFENINKLAQAEQNYRLAIQTSNVHPFGHLFLASVLRKQGKLDEARSEYNLAKDMGEVNCLLLGRYYESQNRLEDALACYELGKESSPPEELPALYQASAVINQDFGNLLEAEADLTRALQLAPGIGTYLDLIYFLMFQKNQPEEAEQILKQAMLLPDLVYDIQINYAQFLQEDGRLEEAETILRNAIQTDPARVDAFDELGKLLEDRGFWKKALQIYEEMAQQPGLAYQALIAAGRLLASHGKFLKAEKAFKNANALDPQNAAGYWELAEVQKIQKKIVEAIALYQQIIAIAQDSNDISLAYTNLGDQYLNVGQFEEAITAFEQALQQNPVNDLASYKLGFALEQVGKFEEASKKYARAVDLNPKYGDAYIGLSRVYGKLNQPEKVVEIARLIGKLNLMPEDAYEANRVIAISYTEAGEYRRAEAAYRKLIGMNSEREDAYMDLADLLVSLKKPEQALKVYQEMAEHPALEYQALLYQGDILSDTGKLAEAEAAYRDAIDRDPDLWYSYIRLVVLLQNQARQEEAHEILHLMKDRPELAAMGYFSLGSVLHQEGKFTDAEKDYLEASRLLPNDPQPYLNLGELYQQSERFEAAEEALQQALQLAPKDPECNRKMAEYYENRDSIKKAIKFYKKAVRNGLDAESMIGLCLKIADLSLYRLKQPQKALDILHEVLLRLPNDPNIHYKLGETYENLKEWRSARDAYNRAIEIDSSFGEGYVALGRVYGRMGEIQGVHQIARKIEGMGLESEHLYDAYQVIAAAYQEGKFIDWALEVFQKSVTLNPNRPEAYVSMGLLYENEKRWTSALDQYLKALQARLEPKNEASIRVGIGYCRYQEMRERKPKDKTLQSIQRESEAEFKRALKLDPGLDEAYLRLGILYEEQERWEEALDIYKKFAANVPQQASSAYLMLAAIQRRLGQLEEQRQSCRAALACIVDPADPDYIGMLRRKGLAHFMLDENKKADEVFRQVLEINDEEFMTYFYQAFNLLCLGKETEAWANLRAGIRLASRDEDYRYALEEANALLKRRPDLTVAQKMNKELIRAKEQLLRESHRDA